MLFRQRVHRLTVYTFFEDTSAAAAGLTPCPYFHGDLTSADVGQLSTYNGRSWFVHTKALAERTKDVIRKTTQVYISDSMTANEVAERHSQAVRYRVGDHRVQFERQGTIGELRHEFAHGNLSVTIF